MPGAVGGGSRKASPDPDYAPKNGDKMIRKMPRHFLQRVMNLKDYVEWRYGKNSHESVYFYTFHKCARSLFGGYVLKNIEGLRHVDYASQIYGGEQIDNPVFEQKGFVYGPIRLSANPLSPVYKKLVEPVSDIDFIRSKIAIFLVRDPRDILVSAYYSFGYTHGFSSVDEIRARQEQRRSEIQRKTIDEYALESAHKILSNFEALDKLSKACNRSVVLKYEDMIDNWDCFVEGLTKYIGIKQTVLTQVYEKSRPREKENQDSHRRSGRPGEFRSKLKEATIASLNTTFRGVLERLQYIA